MRTPDAFRVELITSCFRQVALACLLGAFLAPLTTYAAPPSPGPTHTVSPAPTPAPKCECDGGWYYPIENGICYKQECVTKNITCSAVGKALTVPGMWGPKVQIPCNPAPPKPPSGGGPTQGGGGPPPKPPTKASPTPTPTVTPEAACPGPDDENEFGLVGDGGKIGQCQDGEGEPIPNIPPVEDPDVPGLCYWALRYCVGGCWIYDVQGVNPVPGECP